MDRLDDIAIVRREIGTRIVFTSPDVEGLHVALKPIDEHRAPESIRSARDMLERMRQRIEARRQPASS